MTIFQPGDTLLGKYRIEKLLGRGAFGEVYLAKHMKLHAYRAVKVLRKDTPGLGSTLFNNFRQQFALEAQLGARLSHTNIIHVYDFEQENNMLILSMEYAPRGNLADFLNDKRQRGEILPSRRAIRIAQDIANGLAAVHKRGIVHRDIKPSNIMLGEKGEAKIADFGLAQVPGGPSMRSKLSQPKHHPGTPGYMSPEQKTSLELLTPASDVYSLGLVLYEMLTGQVLFHRDTPIKALQEHLDEDAWLRSRPTAIPPELSTVLGKALAPEPDERYQTAEEFAQALKTVLGEAPTTPHLPPIGYREPSETASQSERSAPSEVPPPPPSQPGKPKSLIWIFSGLFGLILLCMMILALGLFFFLPKPSDETASQIPPSITAVLPAAAPRDTATASPAAWTATPTPAESPTPSPTLPPSSTATSQAEVIPASFQITRLRTIQISAQDDVSSVAFSRDGRLIASAAGDRVVRIWQASDGALLHEMGGHVGSVDSLAFSPRGDWLVSAGMDSIIRVWNVRDGSYERTWEAHKDGIAYVGFSPDGRRLVSGGGWNDASVQLWNPANGQRIGHPFTGPSSSVRSVALSPELSLMAAVSTQTQTVWVWNIERLVISHNLDAPSNPRSVVFSPDGRLLASGWKDGVIRLWKIDLETAAPQDDLTGARGAILSLAFSPDGTRLAAGSENGTVYIWEVDNGQLLATLREHTGPVWSVAFTPDGRTLLTGSADGTAVVWKIDG